MQVIVSLSDGLAGYTFHTLVVRKRPAGSTEPVRAPGPPSPTTHPNTELAGLGYETVRAMLNTGWPALLTSLFFLTTNLSDSMFGDVLGAPFSRPYLLSVSLASISSTRQTHRSSPMRTYIPWPAMPCTFNSTTLHATEPARAQLRTVREILNVGWPAFLAALSFLPTTNLSDSIFDDVISVLQTLAGAAHRT